MRPLSRIRHCLADQCCIDRLELKSPRPNVGAGVALLKPCNVRLVVAERTAHNSIFIKNAGQPLTPIPPWPKPYPQAMKRPLNPLNKTTRMMTKTRHVVAFNV